VGRDIGAEQEDGSRGKRRRKKIKHLVKKKPATVRRTRFTQDLGLAQEEESCRRAGVEFEGIEVPYRAGAKK